ncbi:MAG: phosphatase [Planctomycetes bacterium]|nr:phosphatase [Planctomycetota bacterium]
MDRRGFLHRAGALSLGLMGLRNAVNLAPGRGSGYGPLIADPQGVLDLPAGFTYQLISQVGQTMTDGLMVPDRFDGMCAFDGPDNTVLLVRNHELVETSSNGPFGPNNPLYSQINPSMLYDKGLNTTPSLGGTTTIQFDPATGTVLQQFMSLAGTLRNCGGGPTPWGTWISCEETTQTSGPWHEQDHGFCFEVPASANGQLNAAVPLQAMGRFQREAIAIDPMHGHIYMTEDRPDSLIYRFIPNVPGQLAHGGALQALVVLGYPSLDTTNHAGTSIPVGTRFKTIWTDLRNPMAPLDDLRIRGAAAGAAVFTRGEGMWAGEQDIFFACTNGGASHRGQIWRYRSDPAEHQDQGPTGKLELFLEPNNPSIMENVDAITVSPWGHLFCCEDGPGDDHVVGVCPNGMTYRFARNAADLTEFSGATFSPDGSTLFVSYYRPGRTFAINGPW